MAKLYPGIQIIGPKHDKIPSITKAVSEGDTFRVGNLNIVTLHTPCHTRGHVLYLVKKGEDDESDALFCGDTLFLAGNLLEEED